MVIFVQEKLSKSLPSVVVRSRSRNAGGRGDCLPKRPVGWGIHFRWFFSLQYGLLLTCICRQRIWGARSWAQLFLWSKENFNFGCQERSCLWSAFLSTLQYGTIHYSITRIMPPLYQKLFGIPCTICLSIQFLIHAQAILNCAYLFRPAFRTIIWNKYIKKTTHFLVFGGYPHEVRDGQVGPSSVIYTAGYFWP